jgi:hypothetical protein
MKAYPSYLLATFIWNAGSYAGEHQGYLVATHEKSLSSHQKPLPFNLRVTPHTIDDGRFHNALLGGRDCYPASLMIKDPAQCASWSERDYWDAQLQLFGYRLPYYHQEILPPEMKQFCADGTYVYYIHDDDRILILQQWKLYDFDSFWSFISHYPDYESCVSQLQSIITENHPIKKKLSTQAIRRIAAGHKAVIGHREAQRKKDEEAIALNMRRQEADAFAQRQTFQRMLFQDQVRANCQQQSIDVQEREATWYESSEFYRMYECGDTAHLEKRMKQLKDIKQRGVMYTNANYNVDKLVRDILQSNEFEYAPYVQLYGNQLQHAVHQECIELLSRTATQCELTAQGLHSEILVNCIDAVREYNTSGLVSKACEVADFCWSALEYAKCLADHAISGAISVTRDVAMCSVIYGGALIEGGIQGAVMAVDDMLQHPIQTALTVVAGEYVFAYHLSKVVYNILDLSITSLIDAERAKEKWDAYIDPLNRVINAIADKQTTLRDVVRTGATLATGWKAQTKLLQGCGILYRSARDQVVKYINNNQFMTPEQYMAITEGTLLKFSQEGTKQRPPKEIPIFGWELTGDYPKYTEEAIERGVELLMHNLNDLTHIFGKKRHKLDDLVQQLGGKKELLQNTIRELNGKVPFDRAFEDIIVHIQGHEVYVRGKIVNGIPRISTMFIK